MKVFINPDNTCIIQDAPESEWYTKPNGCVTFCGVKIVGAVYVDTGISFVRTSISKEKHTAFEQVAHSLFKNFKKLGQYDSGNYGYEFTAPNLEIKFS
jgi:hypothetical protein